MNKRKLHHWLTKLRRVRYAYLIAAVLVTGLTAGLALRHNNITALKLRDHLMQVDKDNGDVEAALRQLRSYIYGHMNTDLASPGGVYPPIQLKYRYERLTATANSSAQQNTDAYHNAQVYCEQNFPDSFYGAGRLPCIQNYLDSHPANSPPRTVDIPDSLYKFDFASPVWSPDLAGFSLLACAFFSLLLLSRFVAELLLRRNLRRKLR